MPRRKKLARIVLLHGAEFRRSSRGNMRRLAPAFRSLGFCIVVPTYGFLPAILLGLIPWLDRRIADAMAGFILPGDILVGHSNGATLAYLISKRVKLRGTVLINAALGSDKLPEALFTHVYYNAGDCITRLSAMIPFNIWGMMGGIGYTGKDERVSNFDQNDTFDLPRLWGHSDIFRVGKCRKWARFMAESVLQELFLAHETQQETRHV